MAKGYPDFFGYSVFPQFGIYQVEEKGATVIPAGDSVTVFDVEGKGTIYGGYMFFGKTDITGLITLSLTIDGFTVILPSIKTMLEAGWIGGLDLPFIVTEVNDAIPSYTVIVQANITFAEQFKITASANVTADASVNGKLFWAKLR